MKVRKLGAAALIAALGVTALAPITADAVDATHELKSSGTVEIEAGELDPEKDPIVDPEKPGESLDPSDPNLEKPETPPGEIGMLKASPLDFGKLKVSNAQQTPTAKPYMAGPLDEEGKSVIEDWDSETGKVERGNIVTWGDLRGKDTGYYITAKMTKQFTKGSGDTAKALTGSTLTYANPLLATRSDEATGDTTGGLTPTATFTLGIDGEAAKTVDGKTIADAQTVVNAPVGFGAGYYTLEFGQSSEFLTPAPTEEVPTPEPAESTAGNSITLTIPQATSAKMQAGTYVAEITWTMNYTA